MSLSGSAFSPWAMMKGAKAKAEQLAASLGCPTKSSKDMIKCLRKRPAYQIVQQVKNFKVNQI
jgi:Carboxylesterase.